MWDKIKWVVVGLIIVCLFYLNHQTDTQLKDRIIQLELTSSHYRTDIISLESDIDALTSTIVFWKTQLFKQYDVFKEETMKDIIKPFTNQLTCNENYSLSLLKGMNTISLTQNKRNLLLIHQISGKSTLYLFNPKHKEDIINKKNCFF